MIVKHYTIGTDFCDELIVAEHEDQSIEYKKTIVGNCIVSYVSVLNEHNILNKEIGEYITIDFKSISDAKDRKEIIHCIYECLLKMNDLSKVKKVLVVGLGNRGAVCDALGPKTCDHLLVTSHLYEQNRIEYLKGTRNVACITPGVMGQTGIESANVVVAINTFFKADLVIVVDALATSSLTRINAAIQINNVGIHPGGGIGNHRLELNEDILQCPIIAIGIATVTSIRTILKEIMDHANLKFDIDNLPEHIDVDLIVTPKNMDDILSYLCQILSEGINQYLHDDYKNL